MSARFTYAQHKAWTEEEVATLLDMTSRGLNYAAIAPVLGRSRSGVCAKGRDLGIRIKNICRREPSVPVFPLSGLNLPSVQREVLSRNVSHSSAPDAYAMVSLPRVTILDGPA